MKILYLCHRFPFPPNRGGRIPKILDFRIIERCLERWRDARSELACNAGATT